MRLRGGGLNSVRSLRKSCELRHAHLTGFWPTRAVGSGSFSGQYGRKPESLNTVPKYRFEEVFAMMQLDDLLVCEACRAAVPRQEH
jgi:hypothetical protein